MYLVYNSCNSKFLLLLVNIYLYHYIPDISIFILDTSTYFINFVLLVYQITAFIRSELLLLESNSWPTFSNVEQKKNPDWRTGLSFNINAQ